MLSMKFKWNNHATAITQFAKVKVKITFVGVSSITKAVSLNTLIMKID